MSGSGVDKIRKAQLLNSPKPLKCPSLNNAPKYSLQLRAVDVEFDQVMQWISNTLLLGH